MKPSPAEEISGKGAARGRESLPIGGGTLALPCFFPAISSVKTNLAPFDYVRVLTATEFPQFLISAFDISDCPSNQRKDLEDQLSAAVIRGIVLLDSGNYEKYWHRAAEWTQEQFFSVLGTTACQIAFCYDNQDPPESVPGAIDEVERAVIQAQEHAQNATILPIIHGPILALTEVAAGVVERTQPSMLAVPERLLGEGLLARAKRVHELRLALDSLGTGFTALHLLGTGNPLSILVYTLCGADSFDGLEWCQTVADPTTARLHHFQQRDLVDGLADMTSVADMPYSLGTLVHNLMFYQSLMASISAANTDGSWLALLRQYLPQQFLKKLQALIPELGSSLE